MPSNCWLFLVNVSVSALFVYLMDLDKLLLFVPSNWSMTFEKLTNFFIRYYSNLSQSSIQHVWRNCVLICFSLSRNIYPICPHLNWKIDWFKFFHCLRVVKTAIPVLVFLWSISTPPCQLQGGGAFSVGKCSCHFQSCLYLTDFVAE